MDFKSGLKRLENDTCIFEMALHGAYEGEIDVFVKHLNIFDLVELVMLRKESSMVIQEIIENIIQVNSTSAGNGKCTEEKNVKASGSILCI